MRIRVFHVIPISIIFFPLDEHLVELDGEEHLVILGGEDVRNVDLSNVEVLNTQTEDIGCNPTDLPSGVWGHASVYSSAIHSLITCGGYGNNGPVSSCSVQSKTGHHIIMPPMNSRRYKFAMITIRNQLISIGGFPGGNTMTFPIPACLQF